MYNSVHGSSYINSHRIIISCVTGIFACIAEAVMAVVGAIAGCIECVVAAIASFFAGLVHCVTACLCCGAA